MFIKVAHGIDRKLVFDIGFFFKKKEDKYSVLIGSILNNSWKYSYVMGVFLIEIDCCSLVEKRYKSKLTKEHLLK